MDKRASALENRAAKMLQLLAATVGVLASVVQRCYSILSEVLLEDRSILLQISSLES